MTVFRVGIDQVKDGVDLALEKEMREVKAGSPCLWNEDTLKNFLNLLKIKFENIRFGLLEFELLESVGEIVNKTNVSCVWQNISYT
jgi:hypothetical protein